FLYHEDDDLACRLRTGCGPLMFVNAAKVQHLGGQSSARSPAVAALKAWHMGRSRVYAARKHGRAFAFGHAALQALLQLVSPVNLLSKRKRAKNWAFFKGVFAEGLSGGSATGKTT
ncbi:MAG: hypothetical protein KDE08_06800, partial [Rhodobacteraceae bacterium]|nr:hypothetical protein [Paracoccaceae bacterium]